MIHCDREFFNDLEQGSDEWLAMRCGMFTASTLHNLITPVGTPREGETPDAYIAELAAQRAAGFIDPQFTSADMLRGSADEPFAREIYADRLAPGGVSEVGYVVARLDAAGVAIGCSPDGLVDDDGLLEIKSRRMAHHIRVLASGAVPRDHVIQVQAALLVTGREWCDYVSYCAGLPMMAIRVFPDVALHEAIIAAVGDGERAIAKLIAAMRQATRTTPTERRQDMEVSIT